jgi:hypothetical protein
MAPRDTDKSTALGPGTVKSLEDARKGKPRNFLLICKGTNALYLAVDKRTIKQSSVNEARKAGHTGQPYFGTITGKGVDLVFNLAKSDGYDSEPIKPKELKDFLAEHADIVAKPTFNIVEAAIPIPFDPEDLSHPVVIRFQKLEAVVQKVIAAQPDRKAVLAKTIADIRDLLLDDKFDEADTHITREVEALRAPASTSPSGSNTSTPQGTSPTAAQPSPTDAGQECLARLNAIRPVALETLRQQLGDTSRIRALLEYAEEKSAVGEFASARKALEGLETLIARANQNGAPKDTDVIRPGLVAERKKFVESRWQATVQSMRAEIDKLRSIPPSISPPDTTRILVDGYHRWLVDFTDELNNAILGVRQADDNDTSSLKKARQTIQRFRTEVPGNHLVDHLRAAKAEVGIQVDLESVLLTALVEMENKLAD